MYLESTDDVGRRYGRLEGERTGDMEAIEMVGSKSLVEPMLLRRKMYLY